MLTIRPLTRKDRKILTAMIIELAAKIGNSQFLNIISPEKTTDGNDEGSKGSIETLGIEVFRILLEQLEEKFCSWLADLVGLKTLEEFDSLPFGAEVSIINQVVDAPEFGDFFTQASHLRSKVESFAGLFKKQKIG